MDVIPSAKRANLESIVAEMERAWNAGDGAGFAKPFAPDGDQVNIIGEVMKGRDEIAVRHDGIFKTIYAGSRNSMHLVDARSVAADVVLARVHSILDVPAGPRQGRIEAIMSVVFRKTGERWEIVTLHNTRIMPRS
jgi:uncharacterized protein (TIGR02246 family)